MPISEIMQKIISLREKKLFFYQGLVKTYIAILE